MATKKPVNKVSSLYEHKKHNILQKLRFRELYGEMRQCRTRAKQRLFHQLPHRLAFCLADIVPSSALAAGHVFMGFTKCGQFVLSYTHASDTEIITHQIVNRYRYRLHWWVFVPYSPLRKVAEVMLFGDQDLQQSTFDNTFISICQWPNDLTNILVYASSIVEGNEEVTSQLKRCFVTITAVPSLDNCSDCYQVARSYEEDDIAQQWDSCVQFSCLRHGATVHTSFDVVPPFPRFLPTVQLKRTGFVVLNSGNFIHVLSIQLENMERRPREETVSNMVRCFGKDELTLGAGQLDFSLESVIEMPSPGVLERGMFGLVQNSGDFGESSRDDGSQNCSIRFSHLLAGSSSIITEPIKKTEEILNISDKDREWELLVGNGSSSLVIRGEIMKDRLSNKELNALDPFQVTDPVNDQLCSSDCKQMTINCDIIKPTTLNTVNNNFFTDQTRNVEQQSLLVSSASVIPDYVDGVNEFDRSTCQSGCTSQNSNKLGDCAGTNPGLGSWTESGGFLSPRVSSESRLFRPGGTGVCQNDRGAEREYDFIDEITENECEKLSVYRRKRLADKRYEFSDENLDEAAQRPKYTSCRRQQRPPRVVPSPSRSPRFRSVACHPEWEGGEQANMYRVFCDRLIGSPSSCGSPNDVLRTLDPNVSSPILSPREERWREEVDRLEKVEMQRWNSRESLAYSMSPSYVSMCNDRTPDHTNGFERNSAQAWNCVVDIKRRFIEIDDEMVSVITDIEDDELSTATGYHNALPLEVHGSGYGQLQMVSNGKAEKLMAPGLLVRQVSLDVEQFCYEMAQKICTEDGKKYFCCNDYNVEIIDVCSNSGAILAVASILLQAAPAGTKGKGSADKGVRPSASAFVRCQYRTTATFVFNMDTKEYHLVDQDPMVEEDPYSIDSMDGSENQWWQGAEARARELRLEWSQPLDYYSSVKVLTNEPLLRGASLNHIIEGQHMVALLLGRRQDLP